MKSGSYPCVCTMAVNPSRPTAPPACPAPSRPRAFSLKGRCQRGRRNFDLRPGAHHRRRPCSPQPASEVRCSRSGPTPAMELRVPAGFRCSALLDGWSLAQGHGLAVAVWYSNWARDDHARAPTCAPARVRGADPRGVQGALRCQQPRASVSSRREIVLPLADLLLGDHTCGHLTPDRGGAPCFRRGWRWFPHR